MGFRITAMRIARAVVWVLIAWVLLRGLISIVAPPSAAPVLQEPSGLTREEAEGEPQGVAALFVHEYLTWRQNHADDRALRLRPLISAQLDRQAGWTPATQGSNQTVHGTWPIRTEARGPGRWLVTVAAIVTTEEDREATDRRTIYIAVPMAKVDEAYTVYDYPAIVPPPNAHDVTGTVLPGVEVSDSDGEITDLLTGFFKAFTTGTERDFKYFLVPGTSVSGLSGSFQFERITDLQIRSLEGHTRVTALVLYRDPVSQAQLRQRYVFELSQRDGRWYIQSFM